MNERWEVFDHETVRVVATFWEEPAPQLTAYLEGMGYWVRPHQFNTINEEYL